MGFSLFPKSAKFYEYFAKQSERLREAASLLADIISSPSADGEKVRRIHALAGEGAEMSDEISRQLALTFITPIDREDIHDINVAQDDLIDQIRAIATRFGLYRFDRVPTAARDLAASLATMVDSTASMLAAFIAKKEIREELRALKKTKQESDTLLLLALGELYESPVVDATTTLEIIKLTHIYERFDQALGRAEDLAAIIEGIHLKYA